MPGALERGTDILMLLGASPSAMDPATIASRLRVPTSTVYRILRVLRQKGVVVRSGDGDGYRLGSVVLQWAASVQRGFNLVEVAAPRIRALAQEIGETVQLTVLSGHRAVTVDVAEGPSPVRVAPERGRTLPLHCGAASKAILAFLPEDRRAAIVERAVLERLTSRTITDRRRLLADIRLIRKRGYAVSQGEVYEGARAVGAPIFDDRGAVSGSVAIASPAHRLPSERLKRAATLVVREAAALSRGPAIDENGVVRNA